MTEIDLVDPRSGKNVGKLILEDNWALEYKMLWNAYDLKDESWDRIRMSIILKEKKDEN